MFSAHWVDSLSDDDAARVRGLLRAAAEVDGWPSVARSGPLPGEFTGGVHLLGQSGDELAAYGHLNEGGDAFGRQVAEVIVHPAHRRRGHGRAMVDAVIARSTGTLRAWSHSDLPAAAALARARGFERVRELLRMRADVVERPAPELPEGVRLRTYTPADAQALVDVNARAFSWHPEQGAMTVGDLRTAEGEPWFDPQGFFVAERDGTLVGFHWTKIHPAESGAEPVGEVYVVGVDPSAHGGGLGRALTIAGLEHLRKTGLHQVILYVEGDNTSALALYRRLGFEVELTAAQYERTVAADERAVTGIG